MPKDAHTTDQKKSLTARLLRPKVMILSFLVFLILISPLLIRGWYLRGVPNVPEPFDRAEFASYKVAKADNAYTGYAKALELFVEPDWDFREKSDQVLTEGWYMADEDIRQFLKDNERALLVWKEATQKDQAQYLQADDYSWDQVLTVVGDARAFNRAALFLARKHMAHDEAASAWDWYRAAIRFSRHLGKNGCLVERLVGVDCFELTARQLEVWLADPSVDKELINKAHRELEDDWLLTESNVHIIQLEYFIFCNLIEQIENGESHVLELKAWSNGLNSVDESETLNIVYWLQGEPELGHRLGKLYFRNKLKFYQLPPFQRPLRTGKIGLFEDSDGLVEENSDFTIEDFDRAFSRSPVAQSSFPAMHQVMIASEADKLRYRSLLILFAGQAFYRDHDRFPRKLDELVPQYLAEIPLDNFDGKPLKYRFSESGPVVYSVFENGLDDGGWEWRYEQKPRGQDHPDDLGMQLKLYQPEPLRASKPSAD